MEEEPQPVPKKLRRCRSKASGSGKRRQASEAAEGLSSGHHEDEVGPAPSRVEGSKLGCAGSGFKPDYYDPAKEDAQNPFPDVSPPSKRRRATKLLTLKRPTVKKNLIADFDGAAAAPAAPVALLAIEGPQIAPTDKSAENQKTPDKNAAKQKTPDKNATDQKTPDKNAMDQKTPDKNAVDQKTQDKNAMDQKTQDKNAMEQPQDPQKTPDKLLMNLYSEATPQKASPLAGSVKKLQLALSHLLEISSDEEEAVLAGPDACLQYT